MCVFFGWSNNLCTIRFCYPFLSVSVGTVVVFACCFVVVYSDIDRHAEIKNFAERIAGQRSGRKCR